MFNLKLPSALQKVDHPLLRKVDCELWVKRDDLIHPEISGNKWRKLALNIKEAEQKGFSKVLTFGGAYSNHIAATAAIAGISNLEFHAMIRGEELNPNSNYCLQKANEQGLNLHFISRSDYAELKSIKDWSRMGEEWKDTYIIPEGGGNELGVRGCEEIYNEIELAFDHLYCAAGTGTTAAGILRSLKGEKLHIVSALKGGGFLKEEILKWQTKKEKKHQIELIEDYHFGGFGKVTEELVDFQESCKTEWGLELDYLYTSKAFFALVELLKKEHFPAKSRIVFYHSGGLQGNRGIREHKSQ
ncbi:MAG: 1-aminocyclopropane-1-carboxylate deaminase [Flavobacteriales bacterium]|nr:1-aminocyclopropane-1-carboxylate deaminase [Flavobacteriales bacterium]